MLNYVITIAISAFFVPHYLSIFWEPLRTTPWDIIVGIVVIVVLVPLNIVGIQEAARLNIFLAVIDFATQLLLVFLGFLLIFSPHILRRTCTGRRADVDELRARDSGGDDRVHRDRDRLEPRRGGPRPAALGPARDQLVAIAVFAIYFTLPLDRAVGAAGGDRSRRSDCVTKLGLVRPRAVQERSGARPRREPRAARNGPLAAKIYVGILAATILFIATNAGVIGASRITYAMATYRQLPEVFRRLHPRLKTPWLSLLVFAGVVADPLRCSRGRSTSSGGCTRSARCSRSRSRTPRSSQLRAKTARGELVPRPAEPAHRAVSTGRSSRSSAGSAPASRGSSSSSRTPPTRYAGLGWLALGFVFYPLYRSRVVHAPLSATVRAPSCSGLRRRSSTATSSCRSRRGARSDEAMDVACRLATERGARSSRSR